MADVLHCSKVVIQEAHALGLRVSDGGGGGGGEGVWAMHGQ